MIDLIKITDEEITAFLDGEFEFTPADEISAAIKSSPKFAARVKALSIDKQDYVAAYDGLLNQAPVTPDFSRENSRWNKTSFRNVAAAAGFILLVGIGVNTYFANYAQPKWVTYVASYQSLYSNNTLAHIDQNAFDATQELERVSAAIGRKIELADLVLPEKLDYKRAQILNFRGQDLMQITYLSKSGVPIALCIMRSDTIEQKPEAPQFNSLEGMRSGYWQQNGYQFFLIGGEDSTLIKNLSFEFKNRIL